MHCFLIAALTADGFLADRADQSSMDWTSKEDKAFFVKKTKEAGVAVFGSTTYNTIGRPLKDRLNIVYTNNPSKVPNSQPLPTSSNIDISVPYTTNLEPKSLLENLSQLNKNSIAICGGASIYTLFLEANTVDTLYITLEPVMFGNGINLFTKKLHRNLKLVSTTNLSPQSLLLEYSVTN